MKSTIRVPKIPERGLNKGLTAQELADLTAPVPFNGKSDVRGKLLSELRAFVDKHQIRAIVNGKLY